MVKDQYQLNYTCQPVCAYEVTSHMLHYLFYFTNYDAFSPSVTSADFSRFL